MKTVERGRKIVPSLGNGRESREKEMKHGRAGGVEGKVSHHSSGEGNMGAAAGELRDIACLSLSLNLSITPSPYILFLSSWAPFV